MKEKVVKFWKKMGGNKQYWLIVVSIYFAIITPSANYYFGWGGVKFSFGFYFSMAAIVWLLDKIDDQNYTSHYTATDGISDGSGILILGLLLSVVLGIITALIIP